MFLKNFDFIFAPFRALRGKFSTVKNMKGNVKMDFKRVQNLGGQAGAQVKGAQGKLGAVQGQAKDAQAQAQAAGAAAKGGIPQVGFSGGAPGAPAGAPGAPGAPGAINPNPPIKVMGVFRKKKVCTQCNAELDKSWDSCPYCAQAAQAAAAAAYVPAAPQKTMAVMLDSGGGAGNMQLLGWLVPMTGPQKGQLFTLAPLTTIGTDPKCMVVLSDGYMSSKHAEIKAEGGVWILKDLGSTNGTYVNDKRVDKHELVDNDFVKFGQALVKFKSL